MKCLVFSDSHNDFYFMKKAISLHPDAEVVFFLGDGLSDLEEIYLTFADKKFLAVKGNCDFRMIAMNSFVPKTAEIELLGKKIVYTHGDLYGAKYGMAGLEKLSKEKNADIVLFGHTHTSSVEYVTSEDYKPFYLFNPGSIGRPHLTRPTYGVLTLADGQYLLSHGETNF